MRNIFKKKSFFINKYIYIHIKTFQDYLKFVKRNKTDGFYKTQEILQK